jgi:hypothetical protein
LFGLNLALIYIYSLNIIYLPSEHLLHSHFRAKKLSDEREQRIKELLNMPQNPVCSIF